MLTGKYHKNPELLAKKHFFWRSRMQGKLEKTRPLVAALEEIGAKYNVTAAQVALNWLLGKDERIVAIPGATRAEHLKENVGAIGWTLSDDEHATLDRVST